MPLYIGDYVADTIGLSNAEHGAYLRCIMAYWMAGESLEDRRLKEICGREFNRVQQFFVWEGHRWHHKRIDAELRDADNKMKVARDKAMKGVLARRAKGLLNPMEAE